MRLDRHFQDIEGSTESRDRGFASLSLAAFAPAGSGQSSQWEEVYRRAYLMAVEALRPTLYDRTLVASAN